MGSELRPARWVPRGRVSEEDCGECRLAPQGAQVLCMGWSWLLLPSSVSSASAGWWPASVVDLGAFGPGVRWAGFKIFSPRTHL